MIQWIVFYDDGSTFSNLDGRPGEAPRRGAIVLLQVDSEGKWVFYAQDKLTILCWSWRSPNEWVSCDLIGFIDYLFTHRGELAHIFGSWTSNTNYEKIRVNADKVWKEMSHAI